MQKSKKHLETIPDEFKSLAEAAEFWDTHSIADYEEQFKEVKFDVNIKYSRILIALEKEISKGITKVAMEKGISSETLVNLWLKEKLKREARVN